MAALEGEPADVVLVFATPHYCEDFEELNRSLLKETRARHLIGCSGMGVLSTHGEIESQRGVVVQALASRELSVASFLASLKPHEASVQSLPARPRTTLRSLRDELGQLAPGSLCILLSDVFSAAPARVLDEIESSAKRLPIVGAAASAHPRSGETFQWYGLAPDDFAMERHGVAGIALSGKLQFHVGVAQGCQPIGESYVISKCEHNIIYQIARKPAAEVLKEELLAGLGEENLKQAIGHTFIGLAIDEEKFPLERGDFLVRNMTGLDSETGAIAVAERVRVGQTLQFQLRNRAAATQDMRQMVAELWEATRDHPPTFGLYFNCLGRGRHLFGLPNHDLRIIKEFFGELPLAGFFGNAELAPIGGRNFAHNYTGVLVLCSEGA